MANKLELTWYGKENQINVEPRILIEDKSLSNVINGDTENMLIHGDNLLALKALEKDYAGKIKCIYIDPPYNTGSAFEHYDDNLEHSIWLSLMRERLIILRNLLSEDGSIFVQIDDNEQAYLTILMDEIFGRNNRINTICVNMSNMSGVKVTAAHNGKRFPKIKEYVLLYVKNVDNYKLKIPKRQKDTWDNEYNYIIQEMTVQDYIDFSNGNFEAIDEKLKYWSLKSLKEFAKENNLNFQDDSWKYKNSFRIIATKPNTALLKKCSELTFNTPIARVLTSQGLNKLITTNYNRNTKTARIELVFAKDTSEMFWGDHWDDIVTTGGVGQEGNVEFKNSKKPEKLIERILSASTSKCDIVLDSFLGSGTTAAVAHKMKRKWIGIEMGEHAYTHAKKRLDGVVSGEDKTGISKAFNWQGGGGYRFYELAPSLINEDAFGQKVISTDYNSDMLAAAIALHEGYKYEPDNTCYWKQSHSENNSYLFVTTNHISREIIDSIKTELKDDEFLLISCKSFDSNALVGVKNISIKKIPQSLLSNCEFGVDNYSLNIVSPPVYEEESDDE